MTQSPNYCPVCGVCNGFPLPRQCPVCHTQIPKYDQSDPDSVFFWSEFKDMLEPGEEKARRKSDD